MKNKRVGRELLVLLLVGWMSGRVVETVLLFGSLFLLQSQAGGYSYSSYVGRTIFLAAAWGMMCLFEEVCFSGGLLSLLLVFVNLTILLLAPATNEEKPITEVRKRIVKKRKALYLTVGMSLFVLAMEYHPLATPVLAAPVLAALISEAVNIWGVLAVELMEEESNLE